MNRNGKPLLILGYVKDDGVITASHLRDTFRVDTKHRRSGIPVLLSGKHRVCGLIPSPTTVLNVGHLEALRDGGVIAYPGRNGIKRYPPASEFTARKIAFYEADTTPTNTETAHYPFQALAAAEFGILQATGAVSRWRPLYRNFLHWRQEPFGVIGFGDIGAQVAQIASVTYGLSVGYFSRTRKYEAEENLGVRFFSISELLTSHPNISLNLPRDGSQTFLEVVALTNSATVLINTSNCVTQDIEHAVLTRLREGKMALFITDTASAEFSLWRDSLFNPRTNRLAADLMRAGRLIVTPHTAYKSWEAVEKTLEQAAEPIRQRWISGDFPDETRLAVVDKLYKMIRRY